MTIDIKQSETRNWAQWHLEHPYVSHSDRRPHPSGGYTHNASALKLTKAETEYYSTHKWDEFDAANPHGLEAGQTFNPSLHERVKYSDLWKGDRVAEQGPDGKLGPFMTLAGHVGKSGSAASILLVGHPHINDLKGNLSKRKFVRIKTPSHRTFVFPMSVAESDDKTRNWKLWDEEHPYVPTGHFSHHGGGNGHAWGEAGAAAEEAKHGGVKGFLTKKQKKAAKKAANAPQVKSSTTAPKAPPKPKYTPEEKAAHDAKKAAEAKAQAEADAVYAASRAKYTGTYGGRDLHAEGAWGKQDHRSRYGGVMVNPEGRVLLREPLNHFDGVHWTFPKGHPDRTEHPTITAIRETEEETGMTPQIVGHVPGGFGGSATGSVNHYYLMHDSGNAFNPSLMNGETQKLVWATPQQADEMMQLGTNAHAVHRDRSILRAAVAAHRQAFPEHPAFPELSPLPPPPPPPKPTALPKSSFVSQPHVASSFSPEETVSFKQGKAEALGHATSKGLGWDDAKTMEKTARTKATSAGDKVGKAYFKGVAEGFSQHAKTIETPAPTGGFKGMWYPGMPLRSVVIQSSEARNWAKWHAEHPYVPNHGASEKGGWDRSGDVPRWVQGHEALVSDAAHSWKGNTSDMKNHMKWARLGEPQPDAGSGKIMRAQAEALQHEVTHNSKTVNRPLYRGTKMRGGIPKVGEDVFMHATGFSSNRATAQRFMKSAAKDDHGGGDHHVGVIYHLEKGSKSYRLPVHGGIDESEQEYLSQGRYRVTHTDVSDGGVHVHLQHVDNAVPSDDLQTRNWKKWHEEHPYIDKDYSPHAPSSNAAAHAWGEAGAAAWKLLHPAAFETAKAGTPKNASVSHPGHTAQQTADRSKMMDRFKGEAKSIHKYTPGSTRATNFEQGYVNARMNAHDASIPAPNAQALAVAHNQVSEGMQANQARAKREGVAAGFHAHSIGHGDQTAPASPPEAFAASQAAATEAAQAKAEKAPVTTLLTVAPVPDFTAIKGVQAFNPAIHEKVTASQLKPGDIIAHHEEGKLYPRTHSGGYPNATYEGHQTFYKVKSVEKPYPQVNKVHLEGTDLTMGGGNGTKYARLKVPGSAEIVDPHEAQKAAQEATAAAQKAAGTLKEPVAPAHSAETLGDGKALMQNVHDALHESGLHPMSGYGAEIAGLIPSSHYGSTGFSVKESGPSEVVKAPAATHNLHMILDGDKNGLTYHEHDELDSDGESYSTFHEPTNPEKLHAGIKKALESKVPGLKVDAVKNTGYSTESNDVSYEAAVHFEKPPVAAPKIAPSSSPQPKGTKHNVGGKTYTLQKVEHPDAGHGGHLDHKGTAMSAYHVLDEQGNHVGRIYQKESQITHTGGTKIAYGYSYNKNWLADTIAPGLMSGSPSKGIHEGGVSYPRAKREDALAELDKHLSKIAAEPAKPTAISSVSKPDAATNPTVVYSHPEHSDTWHKLPNGDMQRVKNGGVEEHLAGNMALSMEPNLIAKGWSGASPSLGLSHYSDQYKVEADAAHASIAASGHSPELQSTLNQWTTEMGHLGLTKEQREVVKKGIAEHGKPNPEVWRGEVSATAPKVGDTFNGNLKSFTEAKGGATAYANMGGAMDESMSAVTYHMAPGATKSLDVHSYGTLNGYPEHEHIVNGQFKVAKVEQTASLANGDYENAYHVHLEPVSAPTIETSVVSADAGKPVVPPIGHLGGTSVEHLKAGDQFIHPAHGDAQTVTSVEPGTVPGVTMVHSVKDTALGTSSESHNNFPKGTPVEVIKHAPLNGPPKSEADLKQLKKLDPGDKFSNGETVPDTGSNGGTWHEDANGQAYFLKGAQSDEHAMNEVAGALAYEQAGVTAQKVSLVKMNDGHVKALSHYVPGIKPILSPNDTSDTTRASARKGYGMDALMSHYDLTGLVMSNGEVDGPNLFKDSEGNVTRLDLGGTGRFRAQGGVKAHWKPGDWAGAEHAKNDYETIRKGDQGKLAYGVTGDQLPSDMEASLGRAANFDIAKYHDAMLAHGVSKKFADEQAAVIQQRQEHLHSMGFGDGAVLPKIESSASAPLTYEEGHMAGTKTGENMEGGFYTAPEIHAAAEKVAKDTSPSAPNKAWMAGMVDGLHAHANKMAAPSAFNLPEIVHSETGFAEEGPLTKYLKGSPKHTTFMGAYNEVVGSGFTDAHNAHQQALHHEAQAKKLPAGIAKAAYEGQAAGYHAVAASLNAEDAASVPRLDEEQKNAINKAAYEEGTHWIDNGDHTAHSLQLHAGEVEDSAGKPGTHKHEKAMAKAAGYHQAALDYEYDNAHAPAEKGAGGYAGWAEKGDVYEGGYKVTDTSAVLGEDTGSHRIGIEGPDGKQSHVTVPKNALMSDAIVAHEAKVNNPHPVGVSGMSDMVQVQHLQPGDSLPSGHKITNHYATGPDKYDVAVEGPDGQVSTHLGTAGSLPVNELIHAHEAHPSGEAPPAAVNELWHARLENHEGTSNKFYESEVHELSSGQFSHVTRYGSTNAGAHVTVNSTLHPTQAEAEAAHTKIVGQKLAKGYEFIKQAPVTVAPSESKHTTTVDIGAHADQAEYKTGYEAQHTGGAINLTGHAGKLKMLHGLEERYNGSFPVAGSPGETPGSTAGRIAYTLDHLNGTEEHKPVGGPMTIDQAIAKANSEGYDFNAVYDTKMEQASGWGLPNFKTEIEGHKIDRDLALQDGDHMAAATHQAKIIALQDVLKDQEAAVAAGDAGPHFEPGDMGHVSSLQPGHSYEHPSTGEPKTVESVVHNANSGWSKITHTDGTWYSAASDKYVNMAKENTYGPHEKALPTLDESNLTNAEDLKPRDKFVFSEGGKVHTLTGGGVAPTPLGENEVALHSVDDEGNEKMHVVHKEFQVLKLPSTSSAGAPAGTTWNEMDPSPDTMLQWVKNADGTLTAHTITSEGDSSVFVHHTTPEFVKTVESKLDAGGWEKIEPNGAVGAGVAATWKSSKSDSTYTKNADGSLTYNGSAGTVKTFTGAAAAKQENILANNSDWTKTGGVSVSPSVSAPTTIPEAKSVKVPEGVASEHTDEYLAAHAAGKAQGIDMANIGKTPKQIKAKAATGYAAAKKAKEARDFEEQANSLGYAHGLMAAANEHAANIKSGAVGVQESAAQAAENEDGLSTKTATKITSSTSSVAPPADFTKSFTAAEKLTNLGKTEALPTQAKMEEHQLTQLDAYRVAKQQAIHAAQSMTQEDAVKQAEVHQGRVSKGISASDQAASLGRSHGFAEEAKAKEPVVPQPGEAPPLTSDELKALPAYAKAQDEIKAALTASETSRDFYAHAGKLKGKTDPADQARFLAWSEAAQQLDFQENEKPDIDLVSQSAPLTSDETTAMNEASKASPKESVSDLQKWAYDQGRSMGIDAGNTALDSGHTVADIERTALRHDQLAKTTTGLLQRKHQGIAKGLHRVAANKEQGGSQITTSASHVSPKPDVSYTPPGIGGAGVKAMSSYPAVETTFTSAEKSAIGTWTSDYRFGTQTEFIRSINKLLQGKDPGDGGSAAKAKTFMHMAATKSTPSKQTIYRKTGGKEFSPGQLQKWKAAVANGETVDFSLPLSSHTYGAGVWDGSYQYNIDAGAMAVDIGPYGNHTGELETVTGGLMEVYKIVEENGLTKIFMRQKVHYAH